MRKIILIMFILSMVGLQFSFYTVMDVEVVMNVSLLREIFILGITDNNMGNAIIYIIPLLGIVVSALNVFVEKNISVLTAIISVVGIFYCGFIYFAVTGVGGSINIGFIINTVSYILALTFSVVVLRIKEN